MPPKAEWLRVGQSGKRRRCALAFMRGFSVITIIPGNNLPTEELQKICGRVGSPGHIQTQVVFQFFLGSLAALSANR
jgi:hypothetical protein